MSISPAVRQFIRERAQQLCEYCHADERWQFIRFTIDHIQPLSAAGTDEPQNLALACRNCNERRGNRCEVRAPETGSMVSVFNPRQNSWQEHFAWASDRIRIVGLTPIGRATLELLDLNDGRHGGLVLRVRQRDLEDGYHPPSGDRIVSK